MILQCRVKPAGIQFIPHSKTYLGDYYRFENEDDLRPYGICLFHDGALDSHQYITRDSIINSNDCNLF